MFPLSVVFVLLLLLKGGTNPTIFQKLDISNSDCPLIRPTTSQIYSMGHYRDLIRKRRIRISTQAAGLEWSFSYEKGMQYLSTTTTKKL